MHDSYNYTAGSTQLNVTENKASDIKTILINIGSCDFTLIECPNHKTRQDIYLTVKLAN
jgi:hypothetical protein